MNAAKIQLNNKFSFAVLFYYIIHSLIFMIFSGRLKSVLSLPFIIQDEIKETMER